MMMQTLQETRVGRDELDRLRWAADVLTRLVVVDRREGWTAASAKAVMREAHEAVAAIEHAELEA
jgi:hypothetical protein